MCDAFSTERTLQTQQDRSQTDAKEDGWISFGCQRRLPSKDLVFIHNTASQETPALAHFLEKRSVVCTWPLPEKMTKRCWESRQVCRRCKNLRMLSKKKKKRCFLVIIHAKKALNSELQHHPAAAGMAAEISKTERPPPTTATANWCTGKYWETQRSPWRVNFNTWAFPGKKAATVSIRINSVFLVNYPAEAFGQQHKPADSVAFLV